MQIHTTPPPIPGIPAKVQAVIDRALLKNPDDRYQTSSEMAIDYYLSIGMNRQAETIREPYPVRAEPIEVPAPPELEPMQSQSQAISRVRSRAGSKARATARAGNKAKPTPKPADANQAGMDRCEIIFLDWPLSPCGCWVSNLFSWADFPRHQPRR